MKKKIFIFISLLFFFPFYVNADDIYITDTNLNDTRNYLLKKSESLSSIDLDKDDKITINDLILSKISLETKLEFVSPSNNNLSELSISTISDIDKVSYCTTIDKECIADTNYSYEKGKNIIIADDKSSVNPVVCVKATNKIGVSYNVCKNVQNTDAIYFIDTMSSSNTGGNEYKSNDSILIESNGKFGLIDTGLARNSDAIINFLKEHGVTELEFVILTHLHNDHVGGLTNFTTCSKNIANEFPIKKLYYKSITNNNYFESTYNDIENLESKCNISNINKKIERCHINNDSECITNNEFNFGDFKLKLYNTTPLDVCTERLENADSLGVLATINENKIYFAGDLGNYKNDAKAEGTSCYGKDIYNTESQVANEIGQVDIYKAAHHGYYYYNNSSSVLEKLSPRYVVFTNNNPSKSGLSDDDAKVSNETLERLNALEPKPNLYYTGDGTVVVEFTTNVLTFKQ